MRRHLDDHPGLSSSRVFENSASQPTSPIPASRELSRTPNIPVTSTRASDTSNQKPLGSRQPLALIQETVHAVGGTGSSEMHSGVHYLSSSYQNRVGAAVTTLSQGSLGHSQTSTVHHQLSIQAHQNTQSVHSMQSNSQGNQMQFQRLKVEDALSYLDQVKYKFGNQPQVYNDFLDIMKEFKSQSIDTPGVIQRVSNLFRGHPELIVGFNTFLPPGYRIEVQPNEQVQVSIPGTNVAGGQGPTSLTIHPTGPPSATVHPMPQVNHATRDASPHASPVVKPPPVANSQPHTNSQNQHPLHQNSPPHTQAGGASPATGTNTTSAPPPASQPVEFNHAINYVNKIKNRFQGQPDIYKQFLEILHTYQKEQRNLKDGVHSANKPLTEAEVYDQVAKLFQNQEDLLQEFGQFLPDANGAANALVGLPPPKPANSEHNAVVKKPSLPVKPPIPTNNQSKQIQGIKRPASSAPSPPIKKPKMTSLKDVTLTEAGKYGSLNEYAFFDKVRKALKSQEVYENFLRCLIIYNQELISRSDLVLVVTPFLQKYSDLFKWFKEFVGYKESNNIDIVPKKIETQERERIGDFATEIDYASCVKYGASYRAVPRNYVQPKCSGRTPLCREVLNDTWVSFPSWSEDSTFVSSRKTQFEEYIYRCEDERFELDVVLETNISTVRILEGEMTKINRMSSEEKARYRLDDTLGGNSAVIQQRAIRRVYGDKANDIIEGLKKNPASSVPIVLKRLKVKDEEWRKAQKSFNKIWREQNEKYYLKSLDHQGINFKQNDIKLLRSKTILNEIETLYEERHEQVEDGQADCGPHLKFNYYHKDIYKDAANLTIHHVKRQTGIHKEDKEKIKHLMRQFFPDFFCVPRGDLSDDEMDKDDDMETEDGNESPKTSVYRDLMTLNLACANHNYKRDSSHSERLLMFQDDKIYPRDVDENPMNDPISTETYSIIFVNNHWYIFFRLHQILCLRLWRLYDRARILISEELKDQEERKQSTALALRLKPRSNIDVELYYQAFLDMVKNLLDGNLESSQYEDSLREMFGIHAYLGFTLDKVIQNMVRQLQHMVGDESCSQFMTLYLDESKNKSTGGLCASQHLRQSVENVYQKKAEQVCDENLYKITMFKERGRIAFELLDTDSDNSEDQSSGNKWNAFVRKYTGEESLANLVKEQLTKNPVFLPRQIHNWWSHAKSQSEESSDVREELDESQIDLSRLEDGGAGEAVRGLVGLNAKYRMSKMAENQGSVCRFNVNSYKMMWIMDSENCLYKKKCLTKAQQSHKNVTQKLNKRFHNWHKRWLKINVDDGQEKHCQNWLMGQCEDSIPTNCIRIDNPLKSPYRVYNRYKAQVGDKT
ncbi:paired amphipathic helix protein Sin3a [Trichonephila clavipes]|nr:paired amphipathic helix protein Sin3a [Trichonephila clavipes]